MFDNILEVASNICTWTWEGESAWCLSGPLKRLAYSRIQCQSSSQEKPRNHQTFSSISLLGTLGPGDRRLCMRLVLVSFTLVYSCIIMRHSTIDLSLLHLKRASETQNHLTFPYWVPEHQGTGDFMRSETCACVIHIIYRCMHVH